MCACMFACMYSTAYSLKEVFNVDEVEVVRHERKVSSKAGQMTTTEIYNTGCHLW